MPRCYPLFCGPSALYLSIPFAVLLPSFYPSVFGLLSLITSHLVVLIGRIDTFQTVHAIKIFVPFWTVCISLSHTWVLSLVSPKPLRQTAIIRWTSLGTNDSNRKKGGKTIGRNAARWQRWHCLIVSPDSGLLRFECCCLLDICIPVQCPTSRKRATLPQEADKTGWLHITRTQSDLLPGSPQTSGLLQLCF